MPQIETWSRLPVGIRDHLIERMRDRSINLEDLNQLRIWIESKPNAPEGRWDQRAQRRAQSSPRKALPGERQRINGGEQDHNRRNRRPIKFRQLQAARQEQRRNRSNCRPRRVDESLAAESQTPRPICHSPAIVAWRRAQRCRRERPRSCIAVGCVGMGLRPVPAQYPSAAKLLLAAFSARNEVVPSQSGAQKQKPRYHERGFRKSYCLNYWASLPSD